MLAPLGLALNACPASRETKAGPADAGAVEAGSFAPPFESAPAPAPLPPTATASASAAPTSKRIACPKGMVAVRPKPKSEFDTSDAGVPAGPYCIDKWEASLIDKVSGMVLSPYYPPDRKLAAQLADTWEKERLEIGSDEARAFPLPPLPAWQRQRDVEPMAVSKPGVTPNGYLSSNVADKACRNAGKRLCKYDEWRSACRGEADRQFPYGAEYKQGACNIHRFMHPAAELHDNASIGHLDPRLNLVKEKNGDLGLHVTGATALCKSEWEGDAVWDMNGNLDEWVEDEKGRFAGGFYARSKKDGCESKVTAHVKSYLDYSTGTRCCWAPDMPAPEPGG